MNPNMYRVTMLGNSDVGKTSLIMCKRGKPVNGNILPTINMEVFCYQEMIEDHKIVMQLWDTAGQEKYKSLGNHYFREAAAAIFVYDVTNKRTLMDLDECLVAFQDATGKNTLVFVAANKCELAAEDHPNIIEGRKWAKEHGFPFFCTSAVTGKSVDELFHEVIIQCYKSSLPTLDPGIQYPSKVQVNDAVEHCSDNQSWCYC